MKTLLTLSMLLLFTSAAPAYPKHEQDDEKPDGREEVEELIDQLADQVKQGGDADTLAEGTIGQLATEFEASGPKDRAAIVKALDKCFKEKRATEDDGTRQNKMFVAAANALANMEPESVKVLLSWIDHKTHRDDMDVQSALIRAAGATKSEKAIKPLVKLLTHHVPTMQAAASEALGQYSEAEEDVRKDIFEELLKLMTSVKGRVDSDPQDMEAKKRWGVIYGPVNTSLQALSGHEESDAAAWQHWWNKNKREDWGAA